MSKLVLKLIKLLPFKVKNRLFFGLAFYKRSPVIKRVHNFRRFKLLLEVTQNIF